MLRPFRLKRPVDPDSAMDPDDVLTTKKMLNGLGFMKLPDYGLTPYPDRPMIDAVKSFQRRNRLKVDGVMKPDGPTLASLNHRLGESRPAALSIAPARPLSRVPLPPARNLLDLPRAPNQSDSMIKASLPETRPLSAPRQPSTRPDHPRPGATDKLAAGQALMAWPHISGFLGRMGMIPAWPAVLGGTAAAAGALMGDAVEKRDEESKRMGTAKRTDIAPHVPPPPGFEPPDEEDRPPTKTEFPAAVMEVPTLGGRPINEVIRNDPLIFQEISEDLRKEFSRPLQSHRGDPVTQRWNTRVAGDIFDRAISRWGPEKSKEIGHTGGATHARGNRLPEDHLRNRDVPIGEDGRRGSSNPDITHTHLPSEKKIFANTGRTLKDGRTGVADERRSYERLKKNAVGHLTAFMPKYRPGMDEEAMAKAAEEIYVEVLTELWGPPPERK